MSSEGTLSVGGGEGMRDASSSSSRGSGGRTSVSGGYGGQEGGLVPTNILEVGDNQGKCYNESDEVMGEVVGYESCWRSRGELGHLVENYSIPPHVLVRPAGGEERACSAPKDHWMPLYVHYLATGLRFPIPELLIVLLKEYGLGLTQLVPIGVRGVVGRKMGGFTSHLRELKVGVGTFLLQYRLGEVEKDEVKRLERGGGELRNIMYLTSPEVVESSGIYGRSSLSREEMNRLRAGGRPVRPLKKRSRASTAGAQEKRVGGATSRPHPSGGSRAEVGPSSEPKRGTIEELVARKRTRVEEVQSLQIEAPVEQVASFYESGRTTAKQFISSHFPEVDLQRAKDELAVNGGSGVVRQALETTNLVNAMATEFFDYLQERIALVKKNEELNRQKEEAEKNFGELTSELEKVREELANSRRAAELKEQKRKKCEEALARRENELAEVRKSAELAIHNSVEGHVSNFVKSATFAKVVDLYRLPTLVMAFADYRKKVKAQNPEVDVTSITFGPEEAGVEENGDSKTAEFRPEVKLTWERDEAGKTILPPTLDFEFFAVDEEEAEVAPRTEVADNIRNEEVDQQLQIID
ncbi:hypothetical protein SLEP1_g55445 [Rubroshorea leprosula]|uniref:Uncharacterized protein n=1 Tax=Rubroshorea leprosula TaxID=152421 RepID=A0AAV5MFJ2_9ROSI|nr:hypothetical protein SLEP1_g55445 [Rubroshorea leprosula]